MPRRPARTTQADIARAIRAAKQEGANSIEVRPDGSLLIRLTELTPVDTATRFAAYQDVTL
jgi:hypothetical protein